eukprot:jgi/Ulvmu1/6769/UM030_0107.1
MVATCTSGCSFGFRLFLDLYTLPLRWLLLRFCSQASASRRKGGWNEALQGRSNSRLPDPKLIRGETPLRFESRRMQQQQQQEAQSPAMGGTQFAEVPGATPATPQPQLQPAEVGDQSVQTERPVLRNVANADQLADAVSEGAVHILITAHMDLHLLSRTSSLEITSTESLRGRCPSEPSSTLQGAAHLPKRTTATQCVLRMPAGVLSAAKADPRAPQPPRVWLDNLLLITATAPPPHNASTATPSLDSIDNSTVSSQLTIGPRGEAWLTNVALDSSAVPARGLELQVAARLYARNVTITGCQHSTAPLVSIMPAAALLLNHTTLSRGSPGGGSFAPSASTAPSLGGALRLRTPPPPLAGAAGAAAAPRVWLEGIEVGAVRADEPLVSAQGGGDFVLFSDAADTATSVSTGAVVEAQALPAEGPEPQGFISGSSSWFLASKEAAIGNTSAPFIVASGAQERPPGLPPVATGEAGHVRITHTPTSSAIIIVPSVLASILAAVVIAALTFQFVRTRSTRQRSLPSTMDKSTSGTEKSVQSAHAPGAGRKSSHGGEAAMHARPAATDSDGDSEIAAAGHAGDAPLAGAAAQRPRATYTLVSVPEPHSLRTAADDADGARSEQFAVDVGEGGLSRPLHGDGGSSASDSARGSLSFSYSQFPDSPSSDGASGLSRTSWPAGPRTVFDASAPLSRSVTLCSPAQIFGPPSPARIGTPVAAAYTPPAAVAGAAPAATAAAPTPRPAAAAPRSPGVAAPAGSSRAGGKPPLGAAGTAAEAYAVAPRSGGSVSVHDDISTFSIGLPGPPENHIPDERDQVLTARLDAMHSSREHLGDLFEVLPAGGRRFGRHGIVQPVRRNADGAKMAAKFFRDRSVFDAELRARSMLPLGVVLATKLVDHSTLRSGSDDSGSSLEWAPPAGGGGSGLPPHIVMELGMPLAEWAAARGTAGFAERVRVLEEVARRLDTMHAAGWVHGAVRPGNILLREMGGEWMLTDVCDAAPVGKSRAVFCAPPHSPPEAAAAAVREQSETAAAAASDIWALGVVACQLLAPAAVAQHAALQHDSAAAWEAACGRAPFPWEPAAPERAACVAQLRNTAAAVLSCVARAPADRPPAARLAAMLRDALSDLDEAAAADPKS